MVVTRQLPHPNAVVLRPPNVGVSPFIRFCRWTALIVGVAYGSYRYKYLKKHHPDTRDKWWAVKMAKEKAAAHKAWKANTVSTLELARQMNVDPAMLGVTVDVDPRLFED